MHCCRSDFKTPAQTQTLTIMPTLLSSLIFARGQLLLQKSNLPEDIVINIGKTQITVSVGTVIAAGADPLYPVDTPVIYRNDETVTINHGSNTYDLVNERWVLFSYIPES
jgi:hypothetical protein